MDSRIQKNIHKFDKRFILIGAGAIGMSSWIYMTQILKIPKDKITVCTKDVSNEYKTAAEEFGMKINADMLTKNNYIKVLDDYCNEGDFMINLSVDVYSLALMDYCNKKSMNYIDTCIEPWSGEYDDPKQDIVERSNYFANEELLKFKANNNILKTMISCIGANPGIISHLFKVAIQHINEKEGNDPLKNNREIAEYCEKIKLQTVHCSEHDTQKSNIPREEGEFVNTWSPMGFISEGIQQAAELGWGSHEDKMPYDSKKCGDNTIVINKPGYSTFIKSWTPNYANPQNQEICASCVTHNESITLSRFFSTETNKITFNYAYRPCDAAITSLNEMYATNLRIKPKKTRVMVKDIVEGYDEIGVLLMGKEMKSTYWCGSIISIDQARSIHPWLTATTAPVVAGIMAGIAYAIEYPNLGLIESEEIDTDFILDDPAIQELLGEIVFIEDVPFHPLKDRQHLFKQEVDEENPYCFQNFLLP